MERYADACGFTTVVVFIDKETDTVARTLPLSESGATAAEHLLGGRAAGSQAAPLAVHENGALDVWQYAPPERS